MAMIFQDPMSSLNPVFTIGDQIAETIVLHRGCDRREAWSEAGELLQLVGIADPDRRLRAYPHQLSGGMRQRVMIAIALSCDPALLIADEPTTALDVTIQAQIIDLIERLKRERRMGVLFITHDLGLVADIADRVVVMYGGQVVEEGAAGEVLAAPRHPYTRALLGCIPRRRAVAAATGAYGPIPGTPPSPMRPPPGCRFAPRCALAIEACTTQPIPLLDTGHAHTSRCIRWEKLA
jgi:peptide/nickel transport system ATP-binding protein